MRSLWRAQLYTPRFGHGWLVFLAHAETALGSPLAITHESLKICLADGTSKEHWLGNCWTLCWAVGTTQKGDPRRWLGYNYTHFVYLWCSTPNSALSDLGVWIPPLTRELHFVITLHEVLQLTYDSRLSPRLQGASFVCQENVSLGNHLAVLIMD